MDRREAISTMVRAVVGGIALMAGFRTFKLAQNKPLAFTYVERAKNWTHNGFERCEFEELRVGDVFRQFMPDGTPINEGKLWLCKTAPKPCPEYQGRSTPGNFICDAVPYRPEKYWNYPVSPVGR